MPRKGAANPALSLLPPEAWMDQAECRGMEPELFFPHASNNQYSTGSHILDELAKQVCHTCPVMFQCLEYALVHRIEDGIWGGTGRNERRRIAKGRRALKAMGRDNQGNPVPTDRRDNGQETPDNPAHG